MKKLIFVILVLLFLAACSQNKVSDKNSAVQVEDLYKASQAVNKVKEVIQEQKTKEVEKSEVQTGNISKIEELPTSSCAIFSTSDAVKFCDMPVVGSEFLQNELHDTCNQQFRTQGLPYSYVNVRTLIYKSKEEAEKKLKIDYAAYQGTYDEKNEKLFWKVDDEANTNMGEFWLGKRIVRINEVPKGSCKKFPDLVKSALARGG
ncbi:membrane lipoprotein lipid attachment site-containing protein [Candidatus Woesearchaeota archaeon]|nr:membrane lipoprotein lipid attachment site-containing protein [Candidatus Woesearchaeota archaeon]